MFFNAALTTARTGRRVALGYEVNQAAHGEQALVEGVGCAHGLVLGAWWLARLLYLQRSRGLGGGYWGEVFQQPVKPGDHNRSKT